ncbi:MAG: exonuclease SbcCD subunit D [Paludibacteraceae bacterium]|nr:exonuclease SbcCD subunit D [Paludibacteraceae bacterium]
MKILHTSDWHLGHMLYNFDRTEEQLAMLVQMVNIVKEQKPDLFLLCGDVYHTAQPSVSTQLMFTNAMAEIHEANPDMPIVIIAGNHDSSSRHDIFQRPWKALNVHTIGSLDKDSPEKHIIEMPGKCFIVAVPYAHERNIPDGFFQQLLDVVDRNNSNDLPVIMTAHTTVKGCDFTGHDHFSEYTVGGIDALDIQRMGEGYDYLALGHIHHEQFVHTGKHNVRYCGTPLAVSFDETFNHSVSLIEISKHGESPVVSQIRIDNPWPLVTLPADGWLKWTDAKKALQNFPDDIQAYIRLNVEVDDFLPTEAHTECIDLVKGKKCKFCHINPKRRENRKSDTKMLSVQEFQEVAPIDIARQFAADTHCNFDDDMVSLFKEALQLLEVESRNL